MSDFKVIFQANQADKRRLEKEVLVVNKAKKAMAYDMRKAQAEYREKLHLYRNRQLEIIKNRSVRNPT